MVQVRLSGTGAVEETGVGVGVPGTGELTQAATKLNDIAARRSNTKNTLEGFMVDMTPSFL
jgi:hypothetical protein